MTPRADTVTPRARAIASASTTRYDDRVKAGSLTIAPPLSADSCADSPTQVQLAD